VARLARIAGVLAIPHMMNPQVRLSAATQDLRLRIELEQ